MVKNPPEGYRTVSSYAVVEDPDEVIAFVTGVLGGSVKERVEGPDGRVTHAELIIGDSMVMVGGAGGENAPFPAMLHVYVDDVDDVYRAAIQAGATSIREPEDMFYGDRSGGVADSQGNQWWLSTHVEDVSPEEMARRAAAQGG
jgi:uncharacterized glyoxalase superfamily protein PhnB